MSDEIENFVNRMKEQGVTLEVSGSFTKALPSEKMSISDIIEMQKLDRKGKLNEYLSKQ